MAAKRSTQMTIIGVSVFIIGAGLVFLGLHSKKAAPAAAPAPTQSAPVGTTVHAAGVGPAVVLQCDGALDHALVELVLGAVGLVPDVFPHLVGLEELVLVEEGDAVEVEFLFEVGGHGIVV